MKAYIWNINGQEMTDKDVVAAILERNAIVSKAFFYKLCYPLFASIYNKYYTDCKDVIEFINEIYLFLIYPNKESGKCKLSTFGYRCSFAMWLKIVAENYCHHLFAKKTMITDNIMVDGNRLCVECDSFDADVKNLNMDDAFKILLSMPNKRYRDLIKYRYLEEKSNEETAKLLSMNMANYYNKHKLAKAQFCEALRKEGLR